jgi:arylsulfatase A-like enzyme
MKNSLFTLLLATCSTISIAQSKRPNIIMIAVDDLNDWVGVYSGHPQVKTPNIDKLAKTSMVFRNASCPGPVCGPSRSSLLSGFRPSTTGVYGNDHNMLDYPIPQTHATLPEYFSKNGYLTISSGKIFHKHKTQNAIDHGHWAFDIWDDARGSSKIIEEKYFSRGKGIVNGLKIENALYKGGEGTEFAFGPTSGKKELTADYQTALWFEKQLQQNYDKPFFMSVGISKPHLPFHVPQEFFDMYGLDTLVLPQFKMDDLDDIVDKNGKKVYQPSDDFLWCKYYGIEKDVARAYMAAISYADACIGVVLDAISKSKYANNTIIMLWGDHGWHLGEKLRYRKASLWRESTQLPFIFHVPGMINMQDCYRNVNLLDIYPTLIDLCGLPKKQLDGKSFAPLLKNPKLKWTPTLTTAGEGQHSVISEKWHYIQDKFGTLQLYNLEKDPMEWTNLINSKAPEVLAAVNELRNYVPKKDAPEIKPKREGQKEKVDGKGKPDPTIKAKRNLASLK